MWNQQKSVRTQGQNKMNYDKYDCPSIFLCKVDCTKKEAGPLMLCWILPDIPPMRHSASQHSGWLFRICRIYDTRSPRVLLALSSILTAFQWCHKTMYREVHSERETRPGVECKLWWKFLHNYSLITPWLVSAWWIMVAVKISQLLSSFSMSQRCCLIALFISILPVLYRPQ